MTKYYFKEGEEAYHKDCLEKKLIVSRILKETIEVPKMIKGEIEKRKVIRMVGIECHWWEESKATGDKQLCTYKFHSSELVPKFIRDKGQEEVNKWLSMQE
jgi:hypothetical protein